MIEREDLVPTSDEIRETAGMPDAVAVGYIQAKRRDKRAKTAKDEQVPNIGDLFGGIFKQPGGK